MPQCGEHGKAREIVEQAVGKLIATLETSCPNTALAEIGVYALGALLQHTNSDQPYDAWEAEYLTERLLLALPEAFKERALRETCSRRELIEIARALPPGEDEDREAYEAIEAAMEPVRQMLPRSSPEAFLKWLDGRPNSG